MIKNINIDTFRWDNVRFLFVDSLCDPIATAVELAKNLTDEPLNLSQGVVNKVSSHVELEFRPGVHDVPASPALSSLISGTKRSQVGNRWSRP